MDEKKEKCKRCGASITPKTKRAEFCSPKCKVYWHREKKRGLNNITKPNVEVKPFEQPKTNYQINTKKTFEQLLNDARFGVLNMQELDKANLHPNQRDLILRKI